jgi:polyisoprenyl-phosphate glycosyltransferase
MGHPTSLVIVTPVLNDWPSFAKLVEDIDTQSQLAGWTVTIIAVDDGSRQITLPEASSLNGCVREIRLVALNANQGHQRAIALGLAYVHENLTAERIVIMDSDGEDTPAAMLSLLDAYAEKPGAIVVAQRAKRSESIVFKTFYALYKFAFLILTGKGIAFGNFALVPANRLPNLLFHSGIWNNFAATMLKSRLPIEFIPTIRGVRYEGRSEIGFTGLMIHGFSAISVYSDIVIGRIIALLVASSAVVFLAVLTIIWMKLVMDSFVPGYATYVILFLVSMLSIALFTGFLMIITLLSTREKASDMPTQLLPLMVKRVETVRAQTLREAAS